MENEFYQLALILAIAVGMGAIGSLLRQPLIVMFIAVGICVGPSWLGIAIQDTQVEILAQMGIAVLLFLVGLRLDLHVIQNMGLVALATGLGQVLFTSVVGFVICVALGLDWVPAIYVSVALTFSSTIIIVKLLSDKREIDALHGRIAVGFLIVQDVVVVVAMIILSALGGAQSGRHPGWDAALILAKGTLLLASIGFLMRYVLPQLVHWIARWQELLILFALAWALSLAAFGDWLGFSKEVGSFLAGVSLASTPFRDAIGGRLVSLRDFLLLFFFIELGAGLDLSLVGQQLLPAAVLSLFVLLGNPLVVMVIMGLMGYRRRTSFLAGLTVAQISEFSLILGAMGVTLGHLAAAELGLITMVGMITIGLSTYMILYSQWLYERLAPSLKVFERKFPYRESAIQSTPTHVSEFIVCGLGRYGSHLARYLRQNGVGVLGVDFDPQIIASWQKQGHAVQYGDAEDPELSASLPLHSAQCIVCTAPGLQTNLAFLGSLRDFGYNGSVALTAHQTSDVEKMRAAGASVVLLPFFDAAREAATVLLSQRVTPSEKSTVPSEVLENPSIQ